MRPFVQTMKDLAENGPAAVMLIDIFLIDRDGRFREGNDKTWGAGNWIRCDTCVDSLGYPAYHHREAHP